MGTVLAAAGAGIYYYHKDMTKEELREAGERYAAKTKELACQAYEFSKMLVERAHAMYLASQSGEQEVQTVALASQSGEQEAQTMAGASTYKGQHEISAKRVFRRVSAGTKRVTRSTKVSTKVSTGTYDDGAIDSEL